MQSSQADLESGELISYKVQKRVAKKVLKDIYQQVLAEKSAGKLLIPLLLLLAGIIIPNVFLLGRCDASVERLH